MERTNEDFLKNQILKAIKKEYTDQIKFTINFDPSESKEPKTNQDEIKTFWLLPDKIGKPMDLKSVCSYLVTAHNEIPLWIKLQENSDRATYDLFISKRFRKTTVINEWHKDNEFRPVIIE